MVHGFPLQCVCSPQSIENRPQRHQATKKKTLRYFLSFSAPSLACTVLSIWLLITDCAHRHESHHTCAQVTSLWLSCPSCHTYMDCSVTVLDFRAAYVVETALAIIFSRPSSFIVDMKFTLREPSFIHTHPKTVHTATLICCSLVQGHKADCSGADGGPNASCVHGCTSHHGGSCQLVTFLQATNYQRLF